MSLEAQFDVIRPYPNEEINNAVKRLLATEEFKGVSKWVFRGEPYEETIKRFENVQTAEEFQYLFSRVAVRHVIDFTSSGMTASGLGSIDPSKAYLFIANHRDIVMDSAIMQYVLFTNGSRTSQITFGSNLMTSQVVIDIGKTNKMFTFARSESKIQAYRDALLHSAYMKHVIANENESVWIAQRDGRTKDGNDQTHPGVIKMLLAGSKNPLSSLKDFNIIPVTISYEYEPCDINKVNEKFISQTREYVKAPNEDFMSVLSGITGFKGGLHMAFGQPLNPKIEELENTPDLPLNDAIDAIVTELNDQIHRDYKLWTGNYIAFDKVNGSCSYYNNKYNDADITVFENYLDSRLSKVKQDIPELSQMLYRMYAMPVANYNNYCTKNNICPEVQFENVVVV